MTDQERMDVEDLSAFRARVRKLNAAIAEADDAERRARGEYSQARKRHLEAKARLNEFIGADSRPLPLFDQANGHAPQPVQPVREQPPLRQPSLGACTVAADEEEEARAAVLAQPSMGPARAAEARARAAPTPADDFDAWRKEVRDPAEQAWQRFGHLVRRIRAGKSGSAIRLAPLPPGVRVAAQWDYNAGSGVGGGTPWQDFANEELAALAWIEGMEMWCRSQLLPHNCISQADRKDAAAMLEAIGTMDAAQALALPLEPIDAPEAKKKPRKAKAAPPEPVRAALPGMPEESAADRAARLMGPSLLEQAAARTQAQPAEEPLPPRPDARLLGEGTCAGARIAVWMLPCGQIEATARMDRLGDWWNGTSGREPEPSVKRIMQAVKEACTLPLALTDHRPDDATGMMHFGVRCDPPDAHPEPWRMHSLTTDPELADWIVQCWADNGVRDLGTMAARLESDPEGKGLKKVRRGKLAMMLASSRETMRLVMGGARHAEVQAS